MQWRTKDVLPYSYKMLMLCRLLCANESYTLIKVRVDASVNQINFANLLPGSHCTIRLHAVFNPASLDPGLTFTKLTTFESKYIYL